MFRILARCLSLVTVLVLLSGCDVILDLLDPTPATPPAVAMLPDLPGHKVVEGQMLTDYLSSFAEGAALLTGQPQMAALIVGVDEIISCYQDIGAVQARVYSNETAPLSSGAVAIADREALLDPINLFRCVNPLDAAGEASIQSFTIKPCITSYTLTKDENEFYIVYVGTTEEICQAFCSNLEGCTAH